MILCCFPGGSGLSIPEPPHFPSQITFKNLNLAICELPAVTGGRGEYNRRDFANFIVAAVSHFEFVERQQALIREFRIIQQVGESFIGPEDQVLIVQQVSTFRCIKKVSVNPFPALEQADVKTFLLGPFRPEQISITGFQA